MARPTGKKLERESFQSLEVLGMKISATKLLTFRNLKRWSKQEWKKRTTVKFRPATLGHFTIGQLFHILNMIQIRPYQENHSFIFGKDRFQIRVYKDEEPPDAE